MKSIKKTDLDISRTRILQALANSPFTQPPKKVAPEKDPIYVHPPKNVPEAPTSPPQKMVHQMEIINSYSTSKPTHVLIPPGTEFPIIPIAVNQNVKLPTKIEVPTSIAANHLLNIFMKRMESASAPAKEEFPCKLRATRLEEMLALEQILEDDTNFDMFVSI